MLDPLSSAALSQVARDFARAALAFSNEPGKEHFVALHVGAAVEFLAKSVLSAANPVLLLDLKNAKVDALLHFAGVRPSTNIRTVGLLDAVSRVRSLHSDIHISADELQALVDGRNGAAHAGARALDVSRLLGTFVKLVDRMLVKLDTERETFWGPHTLLADALKADQANKTEARIGLLLAQARARFEALTVHLSTDALMVLNAYQDTLVDNFETRTAECPACGQHAIFDGFHRIEWEWNEDGDRSGTVTFEAAGLKCSFCKLRLEHYQELEAAHVEIEQRIPDADPYVYETYRDEFYDSF